MRYSQVTIGAHLTVCAIALALVAVSQALGQGAGTLTGVVRDSGGRPLEGVVVSLRAGTDSVKATARSNARGEFVLANADTGIQYVAFVKPGHHALEYRWLPKPGERKDIKVVLLAFDTTLDPVVVTANEERRLGARASLRGIVVEDGAMPVAGATVQLTGADRTMATAENGEYTFRFLPARPYTLRVRKPGYEPAGTSVTLDPSDDRNLMIALKRLPAGLAPAVILTRSGYGPDQVRYEEMEERLRWRTFASWVLSADNLKYQEGAPLDLLAKELGVDFVTQTKARRNLLTRGVTSINIGPRGTTSRPIIAETLNYEVPGFACMLINGTRHEYGPLSRYSARDISFLEIYPSGTEVTSTVSSHMQRAACKAASVLQHPTYFVIWLKDTR